MNLNAAIRLLVGLLVLGLVLYYVWLLVAMLPIPAPFGTIILIIIALIFLAALLNYTGLWTGTPPP
jgi:hypothetical protein